MSKNQIMSRKQKPDSTNVQRQQQPPRSEHQTVGDCLKWSPDVTATDRNDNAASTRCHYNSNVAAEVRHRNCQQLPTELPTPTHANWQKQPQQQGREAEETAGEALRGWPRQKRELREAPQEQQDKNDTKISPSFIVPQKKMERKGKTPTGSGGTAVNYGRRSTVTKRSEDADIGDLLSQKYLERDEHITRSRHDVENERKAEEAERRRSARSNRTTQLRSIAVNSKLQVEPKELWKMPRFARNAQARVTTFTAQKQVGGQSRGELHGDDDGVQVTRSPSDNDGGYHYNDDDGYLPPDRVLMYADYNHNEPTGAEISE